MAVLRPEERLGSVVGSYRLERIHARGGMGVLFEGEHVSTGRKVGVKLLQPNLIDSAVYKRRMLQEARFAARLHHPHVVDILDVGEASDECPYLVMEWLEGETLEAYLSRERALSVEEAFRLLVPVMGAVARAHALSVIHRDIKPSNIMLARDEAGRICPTLLDFGVAKQADHQTGLTESGATVGTPHYMAPEQATGGEVGPAADVWSLGVLWYRCLSGSVPFPGTTPTDVLVRVVHDAPTPLVLPNVRHGAALMACIERALEKNMARRFESVEAFARALAAAAAYAQLNLPADPEPIGLPNWSHWLTHAGEVGSTASQATVPGPAGELREPPPQPVESSSGSIVAFNLGAPPRSAGAVSPTERTSEPQSSSSVWRPSRRWLWLSLSALFALVSVWLVVQRQKDVTHEPSVRAAPQVALETPPASAQQPVSIAPAQAAPAQPVLVEPAPAPAPPVTRRSPPRTPAARPAPKDDTASSPAPSGLPQLKEQWQ